MSAGLVLLIVAVFFVWQHLENARDLYGLEAKKKTALRFPETRSAVKYDAATECYAPYCPGDVRKLSSDGTKLLIPDRISALYGSSSGEDSSPSTAHHAVTRDTIDNHIKANGQLQANTAQPVYASKNTVWPPPASAQVGIMARDS